MNFKIVQDWNDKSMRVAITQQINRKRGNWDWLQTRQGNHKHKITEKRLGSTDQEKVMQKAHLGG